MHQRFGRPHGDLPEIEVDAQFLQRAMDKVPVTDRSSADCDQNVDAALQAIFYCLLYFNGIIGNDPLILGSPACSSYDLGNSNTVRCNDLVFSGYLARSNKLIAGSDNGYRGLFEYVNFRIAAGSCQRQRSGIQFTA